MQNLVSLTFPNLKALDKTQAGLFSVSGFLVIYLINKNCHNSTTSDDINIKLGPIPKLNKKNTMASKN